MDQIISNAEERMNKTLSTLEEEYQTIRAGRANPHVLDRVTVSYYGTPTPLRQIANISVPEARMLVIQPYDKSMIKDTEKAILASDVGITPSNDGTVIRLVFPELTGERRQELVKDIRKKAEAAKVAVRNIRRDANESLKKMQKNSEITEDQELDGEDLIQKATDEFIKKIDAAVEKKNEELTTV